MELLKHLGAGKHSGDRRHRRGCGGGRERGEELVNHDELNKNMKKMGRCENVKI
jgi:hypothetical protein